ncbi:hypothetical protein [Micromonospora sp. NPDC005324]|uniref:hypothetical protein n=1 Tax=Micromonospora sp. NPDC005324 TaxID=3157033 RepID=UPI0033BA00A0
MTVSRTRVRSHPAAGPAKPHRKPAEPMLLDPERCACRRPTLVATFRREQLVALELRHLRSDGCAYPPQAIDVDSWLIPW